MSDEYIIYDPAEFDKIEIKPVENSDKITRLRAENEKLREALKPFAEKEYAYEGWADIARAEVWLNVRDIRAAAAAIREMSDE